MDKILACEYAYKNRGDKAVRCHKLDSQDMNFCGHQKFCQKIGTYRTSEFANKCPLRKK